MKIASILLTLSAVFWGSATAFAPAHPHIHLARRQMSNSTANTTALPTELSTSFVFASTAVPTTLATSVLSASVTISETASSTSSASSPTSTTAVIVKSGDTLEKLAMMNGVGICDIAKANNITDPNLIIEGKTIRIPAPTGDKDNTSCL